MLILSRFAGAASVLEAAGALIVNPFDVYDTANVLNRALQMSPEERGDRLEEPSGGRAAERCDDVAPALPPGARKRAAAADRLSGTPRGRRQLEEPGSLEASKMASSDNPKRDPDPDSNTEKPPEDWVTGDKAMTGAQASYLKTLCEEAGEPFDAKLSKAEASLRIRHTLGKTGRGAGGGGEGDRRRG